MPRLAIAAAVLACGVPACLADEAMILLPTPLGARVQAGARSGRSVNLDLRTDGVFVTVSEPVRALTGVPSWEGFGTEGCGERSALEVPDGFSLPHEFAGVRAASRSPLEIVTRVVEFVSCRITADGHDTGPQDAVSVLARGRGRCSGRANLAVGLMRACGIPARTVLGVVVGQRGARWHRWGEAWLGRLGWVAFDPGVSIGLVSVRYLPLVGAGEGSTLAGVRLLRIDERGFAALPVRSGIRTLPTDGVTLRCLAPAGDTVITALLLAPDGSRWARRGRGQVTFEGMLRGRYRLVWCGTGTSAAFDLELGDEREVRVALSPVAEAGT